MIVDNSVIIAMLLKESDHVDWTRTLATAKQTVKMSAGSYLEAGIVTDAKGGAEVSSLLDKLLRRLSIEVVPVTPSQAEIGRAAYARFGRGSGHPARLNYGDCFSYALAIEMGEPLLFKGDDFGHTDVKVG